MPGPVAAPQSISQAQPHSEPTLAVESPASSVPLGGSLFTGGRALPPGVRRQMEDRFGDCFEDVRIHDSPSAAATAGQIGARAFAAGRHIVFANGFYRPGERAGLQLLAHELEHVSQASLHARNSSPARALAIVPDAPARAGAPGQPLAIRRQAMTSSELQSVKPSSPAATTRMGNPSELFTLPAGASLADMQVLMGAVDRIEASQYASGMYVLRYKGAEFSLSHEQRNQVLAKARSALKSAMRESLSRSEGALHRFRDIEKINDEFLITSSAVKAYKWISTFGSFSNPRESVYATHSQSMAAMSRAQGALQADNQFSAALGHLADADKASQRTDVLVRAYVDGLIEGGESLATGLTYTRDAAFITAAAIGVIITGGAALGLAPGVVGTGVGGLTLAQTVTAVTVGAPIVARLAETGVKLGYGDKIDWGRLAFDTVRDVVLAKFGGKLAAGLGGKLAGNPATQTLGKQAIARLLAGSATHVENLAFNQALEQTYQRLRHNKEITWEGFIEPLSAALASPQGWISVVASSAVQTGAAQKVANARAAQSQASTSTPPAASKPAAAPPPKLTIGPPAPKPEIGPPAPTPAVEATSASPGGSKTPKPKAPEIVDPRTKAGKPPRKNMGYVTNEDNSRGRYTDPSEPQVYKRPSVEQSTPKDVAAMPPGERQKIADARATIEKLGRPIKKVKAATPDGEVVRSGSGKRVDPDKATDKVLQKAKEIGHDLEVNSSKDNKIPGSSAASHSEKKVAVTEPGKPIAVDMAMCSDCFRFMTKLARSEGPIVVHEPNVSWVFNRDGSRVGVNANGGGVVLHPEGAPGPAAQAGPIDVSTGGGGQ